MKIDPDKNPTNNTLIQEKQHLVPFVLKDNNNQ